MPNQNPHIAQELLAHQTFLRRLAIDLVGEDADDLVQEVWRRALERPPHHGRQLRGWLARVARNLAADRWRGEARRRSREEPRASEQPEGQELEARLELRKELVGALDFLSPSCRETILLRYFEDLAPRDIARRQGVPVATVKKRLQRGLEQLREALDKRTGGDRATWMSAVTALVAPVDSGVVTGSLVIGGMAMGTMIKVSTAVLVAAACMYFVTRTPKAVSPRMAAVEPLAADGDLVNAAEEATAAIPVTEAEQRIPVADEPAVHVAVATGTNVLHVILEGITEEDAQMARVTLTGVEKGSSWPPNKVDDSWLCQGLTSEFDLDPLLERVTERLKDLRDDELEVEVDHPLHFSETIRIPLSSGVELSSGQTVYKVRVQLAEVVYWPEFSLAVRDAETRNHLEGVELRCIVTAFMGITQRPGVSDPYTVIGDSLNSPIALLGGRRADEPEDRAAGVAIGAAAGEAQRLAEFSQPEENARGVVVFAWAPGYAWGRIVVDVSKNAERELLLVPSAELGVRLANVQLKGYAALEKQATLMVTRARPDGGADDVWNQRLDETLETEGLQLEGLKPGKFAVSVELGTAFSWHKRYVLAREEFSLAAGEMRELELALPDAPLPPERATLGGVVAFPAFGGEEEVRLQVYMADYRYGDADFELSLADMEGVDGALPTWSFRLENLPVGLYQVQLWPFMTSWMIELPAGGREDVELIIPKLAEVLVETVDTQTGKRIPLKTIGYGQREVLPDQVSNGGNHAGEATASIEGEPGRFRFWTAPGAAYVRTYGIPSGLNYGGRRENLELVPGLQSVRFELAPANAIHFEFLVDGAALPREDGIFIGLGRTIRAVDHEGTAATVSYEIVEVSAPGVYEISFEGVGANRFLTIPPQRVDVHEGETARVTVELRRK